MTANLPASASSHCVFARLADPGSPSSRATSGTRAPRFRADINGLRAVAILLVVLFHFSVPGFSAGFIGVDVFFVISGFLITQILLAGEEGGHWRSSRSFDRLESAGIYPPMLALVGILLALGYLFLAPAEYLRLGRHSLFSLAGVANYRFYSETGYFARTANPTGCCTSGRSRWSCSSISRFRQLFCGHTAVGAAG